MVGNEAKRNAEVLRKAKISQLIQALADLVPRDFLTTKNQIDILSGVGNYTNYLQKRLDESLNGDISSARASELSRISALLEESDSKRQKYETLLRLAGVPTDIDEEILIKNNFLSKKQSNAVVRKKIESECKIRLPTMQAIPVTSPIQIPTQSIIVFGGGHFNSIPRPQWESIAPKLPKCLTTKTVATQTETVEFADCAIETDKMLHAEMTSQTEETKTTEIGLQTVLENCDESSQTLQSPEIMTSRSVAYEDGSLNISGGLTSSGSQTRLSVGKSVDSTPNDYRNQIENLKLPNCNLSAGSDVATDSSLFQKQNQNNSQRSKRNFNFTVDALHGANRSIADTAKLPSSTKPILSGARMTAQSNVNNTFSASTEHSDVGRVYGDASSYPSYWSPAMMVDNGPNPVSDSTMDSSQSSARIWPLSNIKRAKPATSTSQYAVSKTLPEISGLVTSGNAMQNLSSTSQWYPDFSANMVGQDQLPHGNWLSNNSTGIAATPSTNSYNYPYNSTEFSYGNPSGAYNSWNFGSAAGFASDSYYNTGGNVPTNYGLYLPPSSYMPSEPNTIVGVTSRDDVIPRKSKKLSDQEKPLPGSTGGLKSDCSSNNVAKGRSFHIDHMLESSAIVPKTSYSNPVGNNLHYLHPHQHTTPNYMMRYLDSVNQTRNL